MSFNEEENNNPFPSGVNVDEVFMDLPIEEDLPVDDKLKDHVLEAKVSSHPAQSLFNNSHNINKLFSQQIEDILVNSEKAKDTEVLIIEATKSNENDHPATSRSYVIYTIKIADDIIVKRRYSEFENLRNILVKLFPLGIIPPVPEKQSITSNFSLSAVPPAALKSSSSENSNKNDLDTTNYIEYRKRLLTSFLQKCIAIDEIRKNFVFLTFLDPHPNFNEFIHIDAVGKLNSTSIYKLSPTDPLSSLENELYSTLPIPSEHSNLSYNPKADTNKEQLAEYSNFEIKFKEYETVLSSISKYNKSIIRSMSELATDYTELGSYFNTLSLEEEPSHVIEKMGQVFDSSFFDVNLFKNLINLKFLEKIIELRNFIKVVRGLIAFNKKKWLQSVEILRLIERNNSILEAEEKIENQSKLIDDALSKSRVLNNGASNVPNHDKVDEEDEEALLSQISQLSDNSLPVVPSSKLFGYKIPGLKKVNKAILSMTDSNPEQTRKQTIAKTKLKILTLNKQLDLVTKDNKLIDGEVIKKLNGFQSWFKLELNELCYQYSKDFKEFLDKSQENWNEANNK